MVIIGPISDHDRFNTNGIRGAHIGARRSTAIEHAWRTHIALGDNTTVRLKNGNLIRTGPCAVPAADALIIKVGHDSAKRPLFVFHIGICWAAGKACGIHAMVAGHRHVETARGGERTDFYLANPAPRGVGRKTILLTTRHLAGMAANAGGHIKHKPPLRALGERVARLIRGGATF